MAYRDAIRSREQLTAVDFTALVTATSIGAGLSRVWFLGCFDIFLQRGHVVLLAITACDA